MDILHAIFFWIGVAAIAASSVLVVAGCIAAKMPRQRTCMCLGCHQPPMPGWRVCLRCRNDKSEHDLMDELQFSRHDG